MTLPLGAEHLLGADALGDAIVRVRRLVEPVREVVGWATVELDRAQREFSGAAHFELAADQLPEPLLGAVGRLLVGPDGAEVLLLEPTTEGPLVAALVRHAEGPVVLYLIARDDPTPTLRSANLDVSPEENGPFGPERRILVGPRTGPFLIVVRG